MNILELFRSGMDTVEIMSYLRMQNGRNIDEAFVYNEIHRLREEEREEKEKRERRKIYQREWQRRYREDLRSARAER